MSASETRDESFDVETDSPYYFNTSHWNAVDGILAGVRERSGLMLLTGPTGSGKTMIMRSISEGLEENTPGFFLQYASLNFREFVNFLHSSLNVEDEIMDAPNKAVALREFLYVQAARGETGVIFIDEAHNLEPDVLKMLPKLARFDALEDGRPVGLQFVLVASEDLREILDDAEFDEVRAKIAVDHTLRFFTRAELKQFLTKRLAPIARVTKEPITEDGVTEMERYTGGSPRLAGMICSHAMLFAAESPGRSIDATMIREAAEALMLSPVEDAFQSDGLETAADAPFSEAEIAGDAPKASPPPPPPRPQTETIYPPKNDEESPMDPSLKSGEDDTANAAPPLDFDAILAASDETSSARLFGEQYEGDEPEDRDAQDLPFDPAAFDRTIDEADDDDRAYDDDDDFDEFDDDDDDFEDERAQRKSGAGKAAILAGGASFLARLGLKSRGAQRPKRPERIIGASRKKDRAEARPAKPGRRGPRTRVKGEREAKLKKAGIAVAAVVVLGLGYTAVKSVMSGLSGMIDSSSDVAGLPALAPPVDSGPTGMQAALSDIPSFQPSAGQGGATGGGFGGALPDIPGNESSGGWGARVVVQVDKALAPLRDSEMVPDIADAMTGAATGALDLADRALSLGEMRAKNDSVGGVFAAASDAVSGMRNDLVRGSLTSQEALEKARDLVNQGDAYFAQRRYIAPSEGNAYDSYREALTLEPENAQAQAGISKLRDYFAQKAEGARDAKQWESANNFFEIAIAIGNLRAVN